MRITVSAAVSTAICLVGTAATAQTVERSVLGWTPEREVVVHLIERGERMVDGVSRDYYVEATALYPRSGPLKLYKHGDPTGPVPDQYASAADSAQGGTIRASASVGRDGASNATGTHRFAWYAKQRIDKPDEKNFVCKLRYRLVLLDKAAKRVYTIKDAEAAGEYSRRQDEARCPSLRVSPHWSSDGQVGFVLLDAGDGATGVFADLTSLDSLPWAAFAPAVPAAAALSSPPEAEAWRALNAGDYDAAHKKFTDANVAGGAALVGALQGNKRATRDADKAFNSSAKSPRDAVLRAAGYVAAGQAKKVSKWIDGAVKSATTYDELLGFAAIFEPVDPRIANQLAVHALSHPSAAQANTAAGWTLLGQGLLDVGEYSKAEEALSKVKTPTAATLAALAVIHLDRRQVNIANNFAEDLLFQNPGDCFAYLVQGRIRSMDGDNNTARALFEASSACDPGLEDAAFYAADFSRLAGDIKRAHAGFEHYLAVAPARGADEIRAARRRIAAQWSKILAREGVLLTDVSCRRGVTGFLCTGTLTNTLPEPSGEVSVQVAVKKKVLGSAVVVDIAPGSQAPFGVSFEAKGLADVKVSAGRNKKERAANEVHVR